VAEAAPDRILHGAAYTTVGQAEAEPERRYAATILAMGHVLITPPLLYPNSGAHYQVAWWDFPSCSREVRAAVSSEGCELTPGGKTMSKGTITLKHPLTHEPLPVIFEQGQPQAVILDLTQFTQIVEALDPVARTDEEEAALLAQSPTFHQLIERSLEDVQFGRIRPWEEVLAEL
jgi:hypothetical protein